MLLDTRPRDELERLYGDQWDRMWRAVFAFSADREIASDAVAEAFAQALRRGDTIRSLDRWLWRTVFRIAAGELKERGRRGPPPVEEAYEMNDLARDLVAAPPSSRRSQRAAVVPHHSAGYPAKEGRGDHRFDDARRPRLAQLRTETTSRALGGRPCLISTTISAH